MDKEFDIILTADRTIMNNYHTNWRESIPAWTQVDMYPSKLFKLFIRKPEHKTGIPKFAPLSLRHVEAKLIDGGFRVKIVISELLEKYVKRTRSVGFSSTDPKGMAFGSIFLHMFCKEKLSKTFFDRLVNSKPIQAARKTGLKVMVGGTGT